MLPPSARELWPFFVRADARRRRRIARVAGLCRTLSPITLHCLPVQNMANIHMLVFWPRGRLPGGAWLSGLTRARWATLDHRSEMPSSNPRDEVTFFTQRCQQALTEWTGLVWIDWSRAWSRADVAARRWRRSGLPTGAAGIRECERERSKRGRRWLTPGLVWGRCWAADGPSDHLAAQT